MTQKSGFLICFTGVDGSGKTTQAKVLTKDLGKAGYDAIYVWSRGQAGWRKVLIKFGRLLLGVSSKKINNVDTEYIQSYQKQKSNRIFRFSIARLIWQMSVKSEHITQIRSDVLRSLKSGKIVVSDRYLWDSTVDLAISFNQKKAWLTNRFNRVAFKMVPEPDLTIFLDIPSDTALLRKNDIPGKDYIENRIGLYHALCKEYSMVWIDGCMEQEEIRKAVRNHVNNLLLSKEKP
jgi:dTMP kinase